jgi:SAM-dependent methyltransferase
MNEPAHPLADELARELSSRPRPARILIVGIGSGRNVPPLIAAGAIVDAVEEDAERAGAAARRFAETPRVRVVRAAYSGPYPFSFGYDAALSTHAFLHGTRAGVAASLAAVRNRLRPGGSLFLTLGSAADPRCGTGRGIEPGVWAELDGPEAGIPHLYLTEPEARTILAGFAIRSLSEAAAAETAGRWAHTEAEAARLVHWFVSTSKL